MSAEDWLERYKRELNPEPWQVELLGLNPSYTHWMPGMDNMSSQAWGAWTMERWGPEIGAIDTHFECVNFHFSVSRNSMDCLSCGGDATLVRACHACEGRGYVFTDPAPFVSLTLWMIYPRKGASAGCLIKRIERDDVPAVMEWLASAAASNAKRFAGVVARHQGQGGSDST